MLQPRPLKIGEAAFQPVFPVLYKYYDTHPLGYAFLENRDALPVEDVEVYLFVDGYMDGPKQSAVLKALPPESQKKINFLALFAPRILEITEDTKLTARISVTYRAKGGAHKSEKTAALHVYNRNAVSWDDNRRAAAYVTSKDPEVLRFTRNVVSWTEDLRAEAVDGAIRKALALHTALNAQGIAYVIDPTTPYRELSQNAADYAYLSSAAASNRASSFEARHPLPWEP